MDINHNMTAGEQEQDAPNHYAPPRISPTLILYSGGFSGEEVQSLHDGVHERLSANRLGTVVFPVEVIAQEFTQISDVDSLCQLLQRNLNDTLELPELQRINESTNNAVRIGEPLEWHLIVVYMQAESEASRDVEQFLSNVLTAAQEAFPSLSLSPYLIVLQKKEDLDASVVSEFWPRFSLFTESPGGATVPWSNVLSVTENLVIALTGSDLAAQINTKADALFGNVADIEWLSVGASAISGSQEAIEQYLENQFYLWLTQPLEPEAGDDKRPLPTATALLNEYRKKQWVSLLETLAENRWMMEESPKTPGTLDRNIASILPERSEVIAEALDDLNADTTLLREHYQHLATSFINTSGSLITKSIDAVYAQLQNGLSQGVGLPLVVEILELLETDLTYQPDFRYNGMPLQPLVAPGARSLNRLAHLHASILQHYKRFLSRYARQWQSPWGIALFMIPAWSLLYGIIRMFYPERRFVVAVVSLALVAVASLGAHLNSVQKIDKLRRRLRERAVSRVGEALLRLLAQLARNNTFVVYSHLRRRRWTLASLHELVSEERLTRHDQRDDLEEAYSEPRALDNTHRVANLAFYQQQFQVEIEQLNTMATTARPYHPSYPIRRLQEWAVPVVTEPVAPSAVNMRYLEEARERTKALLDPIAGGALSAHEHASAHWGSGEYWTWLCDNAYLLAPRGTYTSFAIVLGHSPVVFQGGSMGYFDSEWAKSYSRLYLELLFIRVGIQR